jgi:maltooligosyltrehalose trehalohydrolase
MIMLSPYLPMIFMGDEYGEIAPFEYFIDYETEDLVNAVRKGRIDTFSFLMPPGTEPPDPNAKETFQVSKLDHALRTKGVHRVLLEYHKALIGLRKSIPALAEPNKLRLEVEAFDRQRVLYLRRWKDASEVFAAFNFAEQEIAIGLSVPGGRWKRQFDSADPRWNVDSDLSKAARQHTLRSTGDAEMTLAPHSFVLYLKAGEE